MASAAAVSSLIRAGIEYQEIEPLLREADRLAHHLAGRPGPAALRRLHAVVAAIVPELSLHLEVEEAEVYPAVFGDELRSAVDLLVLDHAGIRGALRRLQRSFDTARASELAGYAAVQRSLVEVVTLVRAHAAKESFLLLRSIDTGDDGDGPG